MFDFNAIISQIILGYIKRVRRGLSMKRWFFYCFFLPLILLSAREAKALSWTIEGTEYPYGKPSVSPALESVRLFSINNPARLPVQTLFSIALLLTEKYPLFLNQPVLFFLP